ncbi:MAG TPA: F0F1 ATP synthase subunit B [Gemmataceae bacterium]|jgi:F-type H+-transporting ATPase subunit b
MRCGWLLLATSLLALTLCLSTACSETKHGESAVTKAEGEFAHETEEVNRDLFGWAMDLGIWTLVVFLVLLFVLGKFAWKPMMQGLEHRERAIHSALHEAQQARDEAAQLRTQFEEELRKADDRARAVLDEARRAAERSTAEMTAEAQKKIQAEHERLQREMTREYEQARRDIQTQVAQLATLITGKVIRRQIDHDDHRQLVDEALTELGQMGDGRR